MISNNVCRYQEVIFFFLTVSLRNLYKYDTLKVSNNSILEKGRGICCLLTSVIEILMLCVLLLLRYT